MGAFKPVSYIPFIDQNIFSFCYDIGIHFRDADFVIPMCHINLAVIIEEQAGIVKSSR